MNNSRKHIKNMNPIEQKIFFGSIALIILLVFLYVFFVVSSIVYTSERKHLVQSLVEARFEVGELETTYLGLSNNINLSFAEESGFEKPETVIFAKRATISKAYTRNQ